MNVSHVVIRNIIAEIQEAGFITKKNALLQCGPAIKGRGKALSKFLLEHFPILQYHVKQSSVTLFVDGLHPPDEVLEKYFECRDPSSIKLKNNEKKKQGNKDVSSTKVGEPLNKETFHESIRNEAIRYAGLCNKEFATEEDWDKREEWEFRRRKGASESKSSTVANFPNIVFLVGEILRAHGDERAQEKRKNEKAHTVGIGVRKISDLLWTRYQLDVSPSTVWRFGTSPRQRLVRRGGRYGFLKCQKVGVRNSQLHKPHCRGEYLAASVRGLKEFLTDHHNRGMRVCFAGIDDMSLTPLISDAVDHRSSHASNRGCTLEGDTHNSLDHSFGYFDHLGRSLKVRTTGIVFCFHDDGEQQDTVKDKYERDHLPRARVTRFFAFNRDNHFDHGDATMSHWRDIESAFDSTYPELEDQPEIFCLISDNGSGYDPVCPRNMHYAKLFMDRHQGIKFLVLMSFAAGESARNFEIERSWAAFIKALIGQQLGSTCLNFILRGPNGAFRGPANNEERKAVVETGCQEMKDIWEDIHVTERDDYIVTPSVTHVGPYLQADIEEAQRVHKFYMKDLSRNQILEMKDLRDAARKAYAVSTSTFNQTCMYNPRYNTDSFKTRLFGPSMRFLYPEPDRTLEDQRKEAGMSVIYDTYLQRRDRHKQIPQQELVYDEDCPVPRNSSDKPWRHCCGHFIMDPAKMKRHSRNI